MESFPITDPFPTDVPGIRTTLSPIVALEEIVTKPETHALSETLAIL